MDIKKQHYSMSLNKKESFDSLAESLVTIRDTLPWNGNTDRPPAYFLSLAVSLYAAEKFDLMESSRNCRCFPMSHSSLCVLRSMVIL